MFKKFSESPILEADSALPPQPLCFAITCFFCNHFEELQTVLHAFFYKQPFFQLNLSVAKRFPELSFKCCLDIA